MAEKEFGFLYEQEFTVKAMRYGLNVLVPTYETQYDRVIDNGENLLKVQVKASRFIKVKRRNHITYEVTMGKGSKVKKMYKPNEVDFFAVYIVQERVWYIFPYDVINSVKISLSPNGDSKYNKYINAWHLLSKTFK